MELKVYASKNCSTCRKALKFLGANQVAYATIPIREQPPTKAELRQMLKHYGGGGIQAGERLEIMHEMRLIVIAATVGEVGPLQGGA